MIFERLKALYKAGKIKNLSNYVAKGLITQEQANEILGGITLPDGLILSDEGEC